MNSTSSAFVPVPDAPLTPARRYAVAAVFGLVLLASMGFPVVMGMQKLFPRPEPVTAKLLAAKLEELKVHCDGWFEPARPWNNGDRVEQGTLLGQYHAPDLAARIAAKEKKLKSLRSRKLLIDEGHAELDGQSADSEVQREFRLVAGDIEAAEFELQQLRELAAQNRIVSPVRGYIHYGLSSSRTVKAHETIAYIFPEDGELLLEVTAPVSYLHELIRRRELVATMPTPQGNAEIKARPLAATLRSEFRKNELDKQELWGRIFCEPEFVPQHARVPGLNGTLN